MSKNDLDIQTEFVYSIYPDKKPMSPTDEVAVKAADSKAKTQQAKKSAIGQTA